MGALEQKILLMTPEVGDGATVFDQSAIVTNADNLLKTQPVDRWRTTDYTVATPAYFILDLGAQYSFDFAWLGFNNSSSSSAMWKLQTDTDTAFSPPTFDSGWISMWESNEAMATAQPDFSGWRRKDTFYDFATGYPTPAIGSAGTQQRQYIKVLCYDDSNPDGYFEAGRFYLGLKEQPAVDIAPGSEMPWPQEDAKVIETHGGVEFSIARPARKKANAILQFTDEDDVMTYLYEVARVIKSSNDMLYMHNPASKWAVHQTIYGTAKPSKVTLPFFSYWLTGLTLRARV